MDVNLEVKGTLAKLLATEDLIVEHRAVETAQFDVDTRVLTLPIWDTSNTVFDLLVAHEVGHALFTPNEDWSDRCKAPQQFVNVCEDVRVEKMMKRKYMGIGKTFYRGYQELNDKDFFDIDGEDLDKFNLADKINLHAKIGPFLGLKFTQQEQEIVNVVEKSETFEDALAAAEALYNFCKQEQDIEEGEGVEQNILQSSESPGIGDSNDDGDNIPSDNDVSFDDDVEDRGDSDSDTSEFPDTSLDVETQKSLGGNLEKLAQQPTRNYVYIQRPKFPLEKIIVKNDYISDSVEEFWDRIYAEPINKGEYLDGVDAALREYKKESEKEVNYLVKEFECKKSADAYARAATARTGVLDTAKLHSYKYNEDVFKKITVLPDGKNHGLLFLLDWSGSMTPTLGSTVKQLLNLVWFCRKVNIPFRVYGFTNCYFLEDETPTYYRQRESSMIPDPKRGDLWVDDSYRLLEFLSSEGNAKKFERQVKNFWRITCGMAHDIEEWVDVPQRFHLSGTPLDLSLQVLHDIIPVFKKKYGVQKVQTVILTDGESEPLGYGCETENPRSFERKIFKRTIRHNKVYLRDRKVGTTYHMKEWMDGTGILIQNLQDSFPEVNFIGIRLTGNGDFSKMVRWFKPGYQPEIYEEWRKNKSAVLEIANYTKFFALSSKEMKNDVDFDPDDNATKAQIRSAFKKSLNKSKFNRKILTEFVELVA